MLDAHAQKIVRSLVGSITPEQMKFVDSYISPHVGLFIPAVGPCFYAISHDHAHPGYSFILNFDDHCELGIDGKVIPSQPGKLCAVSPEIPHHEILTGTFARYVAIMIDRRFFERERLTCAIADTRPFRGEMFTVPAELKLYVKEFMSEYENKLPGHEKLLDAMALQITHTIIRAVYGVSLKREESGQRMQIDRVIEYMHAHYAEKLDAKKLADVAMLSVSHFTRLFKASTGKSPMVFLTDTRLEKARKLLAFHDFTVTEIAYKTGFSSSSHLATQFFEKYKHTPRDYRKTLA